MIIYFYRKIIDGEDVYCLNTDQPGFELLEFVVFLDALEELSKESKDIFKGAKQIQLRIPKEIHQKQGPENKLEELYPYEVKMLNQFFKKPGPFNTF